MPQAMDALSLLMKDHDLVKDIFKKIESSEDEAERKSLFEQFMDEIAIHERIEEEIFYPALQKLPNARADVMEAFEEHHVVDMIMSEMDVEPNDEKWDAKFTVMKENVEHHIKDEEEKLFPKAEKLLGKETLGKLGAQMADLKEEELRALDEQAEEEEPEETMRKR